MRFETDINAKKKHSIELENFLGVDMSSSPLNVSKKRASFSKNLISKDGVNQKRPGWKELFDFGSIYGGYAHKINGIFKFIINNRGTNEEVTIIHCGRQIIQLIHDEVNGFYYQKTFDKYLLDQPSQAFFSNNKLYIIGGNFLEFGVNEANGEYYLSSVKDGDNTYIPTTTIGIAPDGSEDATRAKLDDINLLTSSRKNRLRGIETTEDSLTWTVDNGSILTNSSVKVEILQQDATYKEIGNTKTDKTKLYDSQDNEVGSIDFTNGQITINTSVGLEPIVENEDNIIVTYIPYQASDIISNCSFGIRFGINGLSDTLFLSGNPDYPNQDFYSSTENEDFTYFPEYNSDYFGTITSKIKAFLRVNDGTLAIMKEQSTTEPTIYYRSAVTSDETVGSETIKRIYFPVSSGAIGEGAVNNFANGNLVGDNLFLSHNGIFGLVLADNIVANERFARERDKYIHSSLITHDLENAVATVFNGKYILAVDDVCYVLDSRYKSNTQEDNDDTFNYECWYWDNIPATYFCVFKGKLFFGTRDGRVCEFNESQFEDSTTHYLASLDGDITFEDYTFTANANYEDYIKENTKFSFMIDRLVPFLYNYYNGKFFFRYNHPLINKNAISAILRETDTISVMYLNSLTEIDKLKVGQIIVFSQPGNPDGIASLILNINKTGNNREVYITDPLGMIRGGSQQNIYEIINFKPLYVTNVSENEDEGIDFQLKDGIDGDIIEDFGTTYTLSGNVSYLSAELTIKKPVESVWFSPVLDLGLNDYSKNLDSLTVVLDPNMHGNVNFGYETKKVTLDLVAKQIQSAGTNTSSEFFDFEDIDFNNFTFNTAFASSYTKKLRERNINYIMFKAHSTDNKNSALQSIKVVYTVYKKNRGVR